MRPVRQMALRGLVIVAGVALCALAVLPDGPSASAAGRSRRAWPVLKVVALKHSVTLRSYQGMVYLDPGIGVAAFGSPLELDVARSGYSKPMTITQVIHLPSGRLTRRPLPAWVLSSDWNGLRQFMEVTARDSAGNAVGAERIPFCPNTLWPVRDSRTAPRDPRYPPECVTVPFATGEVWGVQKGWATDPAASNLEGDYVKLPVGVYRVTESVAPAYRRLFHISDRDATATASVRVVQGQGSPPGTPPFHRRGPGFIAPAAAPYLRNPPNAVRPDLVALPAWNIAVSHEADTNTDLLNFTASVWNAGNGMLDVEGFRAANSPVMQAYQYFWRNGRVVGRVRAGTLRFDDRDGHHHWHFPQFASYSLVDTHGALVVRSYKQGFCINPSDEVDLLLRQAVWQTSLVGPPSAACGKPWSLRLAEQLPVGWGDTYTQAVAGQAFDITGVPNGAYYVEVKANPRRSLCETTTRNDVSYREVILGGVPGHRTVQVPPWHGISG